MKVKKQKIDELRLEYDFDYSKAARGKYCRLAADSDIEKAAVSDQSDEFLSQEELRYYMSLDDKK